jgi:hypothetical protein
MNRPAPARRALLGLLTVLLTVSFILTSCGGDGGFRAEYPDGYTPAYFYEHYIPCDPNLIPLRAAEDSAGRYKKNPYRVDFYAVEGVPAEEYVCYRLRFVTDVHVGIARNASVEMPAQELLTWTVTAAELCWCEQISEASPKDMPAYGEELYYLKQADLDGASLQAHLKDCLTSGNYFDQGWNMISKRQGTIFLTIRLHFAEQEGIVWEGRVVTVAGEEGYFVFGHVLNTTETFPKVGYLYAIMPLPDEVAELIPKY